MLTTDIDADLLDPAFVDAATVEIPFSFQSLDLGTIGPGERIEIEYLLTHEGFLPVFAELPPQWEFRDPADLTVDPLVFNGNPQYPTVAFSPLTVAVPAPPAPLLFATGLTAISLIRVSRRGRRAA